MSRIIIALALLTPVTAFAGGPVLSPASPGEGPEERPPLEQVIHSIGNLVTSLMNDGLWGDPWGNYSSGEWPGGEGSDYLWIGSFWSCCYVSIAPDSAPEKWSGVEMSPSDGYPLEYLTPGPVAPEETHYGFDDWDPEVSDNPYGLGVWEENYSWDVQGYDNFIATLLVMTHHSEYGNPGVPLNAFVAGYSIDFDVATADIGDCHLDDAVYYDGHAIWCNDPGASFEYQFDDETGASGQDDYTWQQNPDNPLPPDDPENIWYHYNYTGSDGIPDNDVDQNGVSDHFTILAKVTGGDTLYWEDPESGVILFSEGMPYWHFQHTIGDTTFLVVPRNLSYMWDSDDPVSGTDDSGEPETSPPCNGFIGWRLLDCWIVKADQTVERPIDVFGCPIPVSHSWWNWEGDPGTDIEKYDYMWGLNPDASGQFSGPAYMEDWVGDPCAPEAVEPQNPGPFPFVHDSPFAFGYPAFDYRVLLSFGPVDLADGDSLFIVGGWVIGRGLDGLRLNADLLLDAYCRESIWGAGLGVETANPVMPPGVMVRPNPFSTHGSAVFTLQSACHVRLSIYDISGRLVEEVVDSGLQAGSYTFTIGGNHLGSGVYFLRLQTGDEVGAGRFVVLR